MKRLPIPDPAVTPQRLAQAKVPFELARWYHTTARRLQVFTANQIVMIHAVHMRVFSSA